MHELFSYTSTSAQSEGDIAMTNASAYPFLTIVFSYSTTDNTYVSVTIPNTIGKKASAFVYASDSTRLYVGARVVEIKDATHLTLGQGYLFMGSVTPNADNSYALVRRVYGHY